MVLLASINAALPVAFQSSSGRRETTGKYGVICTRLGLLLHHRVCKKPGGHSAEAGPARVRGRHHADPTFLSETETQETRVERATKIRDAEK